MKRVERKTDAAIGWAYSGVVLVDQVMSRPEICRLDRYKV